MVYVANPLYDAVFKYLMEDERIAKTILSALLQKEVLEVKMRRNEYSNINRNAIYSPPTQKKGTEISEMKFQSP